MRILWSICILAFIACNTKVKQGETSGPITSQLFSKDTIRTQRFNLDSTHTTALKYQTVSGSVNVKKTYSILDNLQSYGRETRVLKTPQNLNVTTFPVAYQWIENKYIKPEREPALPPYTRDQNTASFCCYGKQQGLRHNRIYDITEDHQRALWLATNEGVVRFNGISYDHYNRHCGMPSNYIRFVMCDRTGRIWCGTEDGGLVWIKNNTLHVCKVSNAQVQSVTSIYEDAHGTIWIGTKEGIYKLDDFGLYAFEGLGVVSVNAISGSGDTVYVATENSGLLCFQSNTCVRFPIEQTGLQVQNVYAVNAKKLYGFSVQKGVFEVKNTSISYINTPEFNFEHVYHIHADQSDCLWFGTDKGVLKLDPSNRFQVLTERDGLSDNTVYSIYEDLAHELWFGTRVNLSKYNGFRFKHITHAGIPIGERIWAIAPDVHSGALLLSNSGELSRLHHNTIDLIHWNTSGNFQNPQALCKADEMHYIASQTGLSALNANSVNHFTDSSGYLNSINTMAYHNHSKVLWMGTSKGKLLFLKDKKIVVHPASQLLNAIPITALQIMDSGIYIGTQSGKVFVLKNQQFQQILLPSLKNVPILALHQDAFKTLWIGTEGEGLLALNKTTLTQYGTESGLPNLNIISINTDKSQRLWIGTRNGIAYKLESNSESSKKFKCFQFRDGFVGIGVNSEHCIHESDSNQLLVAANDRLTIVNTSQLKKQNVPLRLELNHIRVFNYDVPWHTIFKNDTLIWFSNQTQLIQPQVISRFASGMPNAISLHHKNNTLDIEFSAIEPGHPENIEYTYRVLGSFDEWSKPFTLNRIQLTQIPPETYTIEIKCRRQSETWSKPLRLYITIRTPFWKTNTFIVLLGLVCILIVFLIFKQRTRILERRQKKLEHVVKVRTQELRKKHEEVALQHKIISKKQHEILDSLHYARKIQYALLAHDDFLNQHLSKYFILYKTKDVVSGDFYWATKKNAWFYIAVCDSTGHGVPGAFMSLLNMSFMNEAINEQEIEKPGEVFQFVKNRLIQHIGKEGRRDGFDGILLAINMETRELCYAAANNKPVLLHQHSTGETEAVNQWLHNPLPCDRMAVGLSDSNMPYKTFSCHYNSGDMIYLCSDGYPDQFGGPAGKKFKYRPFYSLLESIAAKPEAEQLHILNTTLISWMGDQEQVDDICIIGIRL